MGDEVERADLGAERFDGGVVDIPHGHAVRRQAEGVVVERGADATDAAVGEHGAQARDDEFFGYADCGGHLCVGLRGQRQTGLGRLDDRAVDRVHWRPGGAHAETFISRKNSRSFGNMKTRSPVSASIWRPTASISSARSTARTNHMLSAWSRR